MQIDRACREFSWGNTTLVRALPEFEHSKWTGSRNFYRIDRTSRAAAGIARLLERWLRSLTFVYPLQPVLIHGPPRIGEHMFRVGYRKIPFDRRIRSAGWVFNSVYPDYLAYDLYYTRPGNTTGHLPDIASMELRNNEFFGFFKDYPSFHALRRVDIVVRYSHAQLPLATRHVRRMKERFEYTWRALNVHNGVVRVFWESESRRERLRREWVR